MYWDASDRRNERSNAIARATFRVGPTHKPTIFRSRRIILSALGRSITVSATG